MMDSIEYKHLLRKALDAKSGGKGSWDVMSTGERVAVAVVLNRPEWLAEDNFTMAEAFDRIGEAWWPLLLPVQRALGCE